MQPFVPCMSTASAEASTAAMAGHGGGGDYSPWRTVRTRLCAATLVVLSLAASAQAQVRKHSSTGLPV